MTRTGSATGAQMSPLDTIVNPLRSRLREAVANKDDVDQAVPFISEVLEAEHRRRHALPFPTNTRRPDVSRSACSADA
jgi:hypothetical protein